MLSIPFIAVLQDPADGQVSALPLLAADADEAVTMVHGVHPALRLRGLYDHDTLSQWQAELAALQGTASRYIAVVVQDGASSFLPVAASDDGAAWHHAQAMRPDGQINGLFVQAVIDGFLRDLDALPTA